jgi:predicted metalloprotease with PDZ domain
MRAWMARALETTEELSADEALAWLGLRMTPPPTSPRAYLGVMTRIDNGKTVVTGIRRGSPAAAAGLSLLDEIVALNGEPLNGPLAARLERLQPGANVAVAVVRRGETRSVSVVLATDPGHGWQLSTSPVATREQSQHFDAWTASP